MKGTFINKKVGRIPHKSGKYSLKLNAGGVSLKKRLKFKAYSEPMSLTRYSDRIGLFLICMAKGDRVRLDYGAYTRYVTANKIKQWPGLVYDGAELDIKGSFPKARKAKVTIYNKYGEKIRTKTLKLDKKGNYDMGGAI